MRNLLILLAGAAALGPALNAKVYLSPAWSKVPKDGWVLAVLPATCEMTVEGVASTGLHREESQALEARLSAAVAQALQSKGWHIADDVFHRVGIERDSEIFFLVRYLRERNVTMTERIALAPKAFRSGGSSLGNAVNAVRPYTKANILVFVHVRGFRITTAQRILAIAWTGFYYGTVGLILNDQLFRGTTFKIGASFVDGETGDILCVVQPGRDGPEAFLKELDKLPH